MNHNDEFDQILDEALAKYSAAEPLAGMEHRILERVRMQAKRNRKTWRWGVFAACTALLAVAAWIGLREPDRREIAPMQTATAQPQRLPVEPQPKNTNASPPITPTRPLIARVHSRGPNVAGEKVLESTGRTRPEFPTPEPLNSEERALLALAQTHPEVLSRLADHDDQEIAIAPINIQPLANAPGSKQGEN
jgi:hypothetical protein